MSNLLCFPEFLNDLCCHLIVFQEVIGDGIANPGGPLGWTQLQQLVPCLLEKDNVPALSSFDIRWKNSTFPISPHYLKREAVLGR